MMTEAIKLTPTNQLILNNMMLLKMLSLTFFVTP